MVKTFPPKKKERNSSLHFAMFNFFFFYFNSISIRTNLVIENLIRIPREYNVKFTQDAREKEKRALCSLHILGDSQDIFSFNYLGANYRKLHTRWRAPGPANAIIITPTANIVSH